MKIYIIFDGGNGASVEKDAYGSYIIKDKKESKGTLTRRVVFGKGYTNNEAEYMTLIDALDFLVKLLPDMLSVIDLTIEGDSELVRNQIGNCRTSEHGTSWAGWKVNVEHLLPLRNKARGLLQQFRSFTYNHIPRKEVVAVLGH